MKQVLSFILIFLMLACSSGGQETVFEYELPAVDFDRQDFPVSVVLPEGTIPEGEIAALYELDGKKKIRINSQYSPDRNELSWVVEGLTPAREERKYEVGLTKQTREAAVMSVEENDSTLLISKGGLPVLHYRHSVLPAPEGQSYLYERSGFIHPLYSPSGEVLTWAQPPDHFHHVGLWNPWTKVTWKENHTDFWNLGSGLGTVSFKEIEATESGSVFAEFRVMQDHIAFVPPKPKDIGEKYEGEEVIVMEEEWIVRVWNVEDGFLIDFTSLLNNVIDEPVSLEAYRYGGGLGYRATGKWTQENSDALTSEGKVRKNGDATRAKWCWIYGDLDGVNTGLLFMSDTTNYDFPQPMRIWPEGSNGVGHQYFEFTPIREKAWIIDPGKTYSQKYRIWIKEGEFGHDEAEQQWLQYVHQAKK